MQTVLVDWLPRRVPVEFLFSTPEPALDTILAIDLGKFNAVLFWYNDSSKVTSFRTVPMKEGTMRQLGYDLMKKTESDNEMSASDTLLSAPPCLTGSSATA